MSPIMAGSPPMTTYLVKQIEAAVRAHLDVVLRAHALTTVQYTALTVLEHRENLSSAQLARRSFVKPQTMHELVVTLERMGLIMRLTPDGRQKLGECHVDVEAIEKQMVADLSAAELAMLRALLERCHASLAPH
jgi:DNA-binding MarR family transcriptional regulator